MEKHAEFSLVSLKKYIRTQKIGSNVICLKTIDSTNSEAKRRSLEEAEGTVFLSEQQTAGRGRLGREWASPDGKGIWMSVLLKPAISPDKIPQLTTVAAAAVSLALESIDTVFDTMLRIKWPNDILLGAKKAGGILTEMQMCGDIVQAVVIGIGLNVSLKENDFPHQLRQQATSLLLETGVSYDRVIIIAQIINFLESLYQEFLTEGDLGRSLAICRKRSAVIGRKVQLLHQGNKEEVEVLDLGCQGELVVKHADGTRSSIISGEISIRME